MKNKFTVSDGNGVAIELSDFDIHRFKEFLHIQTGIKLIQQWVGESEDEDMVSRCEEMLARDNASEFLAIGKAWQRELQSEGDELMLDFIHDTLSGKIYKEVNQHDSL